MRNGGPTLTLLGGAHTVTGSKTLLEAAGSRVLVDCGLFQGRKELRLANWAPFPVEPASIDAVVLTHAHIDHCGYLPRLRRQGFRGPVFATSGTRALASIVLPDSGHLQEEDAAYANRRGYSKHHPAEPLYTEAEAVEVLDQFVTVPFHSTRTVANGVDVGWQRAGHILGASCLRVLTNGATVLFSGDLGRPTHPLFLPPDPAGAADVVVVESTYGDEEHHIADVAGTIADVVHTAVDRRGVVIVPAFAVDRTEVVLWHLDRLTADGAIPRVPVVLDSPLASRALEIYREELRAGSPEFRPELLGTELFGSLDLTVTTSVDESKALNDRDGPLVIVSASGMATGGRVVHHLARRLGDDRTTVLLVGFQAPGTRGDRLRQGATEIRMFGQDHQVRARIVGLELSTHADRSELIDWLRTADGFRHAVVNHGEYVASTCLAGEIERSLGKPASAPASGRPVALAAVSADRRPS